MSTPSPEQAEEHAVWAYWEQHRWTPLEECPPEVRERYLARVAAAKAGPYGWR